MKETFSNLHLRVSEGPKQEHINPINLRDVCCEFFKITLADFIGKKRHAHIVKARQAFSYICRTETKMRLCDIGFMMGGRDHSTVLHQLETIQNEMNVYREVARIIRSIKNSAITGAGLKDSIINYSVLLPVEDDRTAKIKVVPEVEQKKGIEEKIKHDSNIFSIPSDRYLYNGAEIRRAKYGL